MPSLNRLWARLAHLTSLKAASSIGTIIICLAFIILPALFKAYPFQKQQPSTRKVAGAAASASADKSAGAAAAVNAQPTGTLEPGLALPVYATSLPGSSGGGGIYRIAQVHTTLQPEDTLEIKQYTVKEGDTIFDIADKFGLKPSTILWGNLTKLADNPEMIHPGQVLDILPVDGVYYEWHAGDGLNGVAKVLGVKPEDIVNYPGNHLDPNTIGNYSNPNIKPGTWIIIPGGYRNFITWSAPTISRFSPSVAKIYGPGACESPSDGAVGTGSFTWPTVAHWLSGYDYTPGANHSAVDFAGQLGNAIYAADNGVVVYAGWNDWGYGNVTVVDHGNGYQTLYAHQTQVNVQCGQSVYKGDLIGLLGSTGRSSGPHLHFEIMYNGSRLDPHGFLPIEGKK